MSKHAIKKHKTPSEDTMFFPTFQREMNRLFDQFRIGVPVADNLSSSIFGAEGFPAIDIVDKDNAVEVSAELPGVKEDDLDISLSGDVLTLKGEKSYDHEEKEESFHRIERRYGSFRRQISLGFTPESDAVTAKFVDGILTLTVDKPATAKTEVRKIDIKKS